MRLEIDNCDGLGPRDYSGSIDAEQAIRISRKLNRASQMVAVLVAADPAFIVPACNARVTVTGALGKKLFTGYLTQAPEYEYLGWLHTGPAYRYTLRATSDEVLLDGKQLPKRADFVARSTGDILTQITESAIPGAFDRGGVEALAVLPSYYASRERCWSEHAAELGIRARGCYRAHDGKITFTPLGRTAHSISESDPTFSPDALKITSSDSVVNDVTVSGYVEPRGYVTEYFLGDGLSSGFRLSETPFSSHAFVILDEEFGGSRLDPLRWHATGNGIAVMSGKLCANADSADSTVTASFSEQIELGGALLLQHGEIEFIGSSFNALVGGLYANGEIGEGQCIAGFCATADGRLTAVVNGTRTGTNVALQSGHRYALSTRVYATEQYRSEQVFHSSRVCHVGNQKDCSARIVLEVHDVDPADPASYGAIAKVLYDGSIAVPAYATYALVNAGQLQANISYARITRMADVQVETQLPGGASRQRIVGTSADGAECWVSDTQVWFYDQYVPAPDEMIRVKYRAGQRSVARVVDPASSAAHARGTDDGVRARAISLKTPTPRTSDECALAAQAILDDSTQRAWAGEYEFNNYDVLPGEAVQVEAPSRQAVFTAIVREVTVTCATEGDRFHLRFANDAAEPLSHVVDVPTTDVAASEQFIDDLTRAKVTDVTSTTITIDAGSPPPMGGAIEVRRSDRGWGQEADRNLVGRFTSQTFTVTRLARTQTFYLKQYDADATPHYSRNVAVLHIDYPL